MAKPTAEYNIKSKDETSKGLSSAKKNLSTFEFDIKAAFKGIAIASAAVTGAVTALAIGFNKLTDIYGKQERAQIQLAAAARNNPLIDGKAVSGLMDYASALQQVTTFGDEALLPFMSMGVAMGHTEETIRKVSDAAVNFAAGTGMTLDATFRNLYKTLGGMTGELGESIPALRDLTAEQLRNGEAVEYISRQYAGMAEAVAGSTLGIKEQLSNSFGDMLESIGKGLAPVGNIILQNVKPALDSIGQWFTDNSSQITNFFLHFGEIARSVINRVGEGFRNMFTFGWVVDYASTVFEGIKNIFVRTMEFIARIVLAVGTTMWLPLKKGFEWIGYGIKVAWQSLINGLARGINWLVENPINSIALAFKSVVNGIGEGIQWVLNGIVGLINGVITALNVILKGAHDATEALAHPFNPNNRQQFTAAIPQVQSRVDIEWLDPALHNRLTTNLTNFVEDIDAIPRPEANFDEIAAQIGQVWRDAGEAGVDLIKANLSNISGIASVMADPFVESFTGFSVEFKEILMRELPPEAISTFEGILATLEDTAVAAVPTKWQIFTRYLSAIFTGIGDQFKNIIPTLRTVVGNIEAAVRDPGQALSNVLDNIKEGIGRAGIGLISKIVGIDIETGEAITKEDKEQGFLSKVFTSLGRWVMDLISSSEGLVAVFDFLSQSITPLVENIITPIAKALVPIIDLIVMFATKLVATLQPVIDSIVNILNSLIEPIGRLLDLVLTALQPVINIVVQALEIVGALLIQIMPAIESVLNAFVNILAPVINFIAGLLSALSPVFELIGNILLAVAPVIEAIGYLLNAILGPALSFIAELIGAVLTPVIQVITMVLTVLTPIFQIIGNIMKAIAPVFAILFNLLNILLIPLQLLSVVLDLINPIFVFLANILNFLNPVIVFFAKIIDAVSRPIEFVGDLLSWLGNGLKALGQAIWYLITFQWGKMGDIRWPGAFQSDAFSRPLLDINSPSTDTAPLDLTGTTAPASTSAVLDTGYAGTGATYGTNNLTLNVVINTDVIAGEGGIRDLALIIDKEITALRSLGIA